MTQTTTNITLNGSRLIRLLSELAVCDIEPSSRNFGGRFGQLFALSDSISLSEMHGELANTHFESRPVDSDAISQSFLSSQKKVVDSISRRFITEAEDNNLRNRFPALRAGASAEQLSSYEAYQGFYVTLQREMDREVQHIQSLVRDAAAGASAKLAQLVVIDQTLGDTLTAHSRKLLAQVPRLLNLRFEYLLQHHHQALFNADQNDVSSWLETGGWLDRFRLEMHQTALAELELRLQPALGLMAALRAQSSAPAQQTTTANTPPQPSQQRYAL